MSTHPVEQNDIQSNIRPTATDAARNELRQVLRALRREIRDSPLSQSQIEERIGWNQGYLSQVLTGKIALRMEHVLSLALVVDGSPGGFFVKIFPSSQPSVEELKAELGRVRREVADFQRVIGQLRRKGLVDLD